MAEQLLVYTLVLLSFAYVGYRIYSGLKRKQACSNCALMDATKK